MSPRKQAERELKAAGLIKYRTHGGHDIWKDTATGQIIPLKRGSGFNDNDLKYIRKEIESIKRGRQ